MALTTGENCRLVAGIRNGSRALEQAGTQGKSKQKPTRRNRGTTWWLVFPDLTVISHSPTVRQLFSFLECHVNIVTDFKLPWCWQTPPGGPLPARAKKQDKTIKKKKRIHRLDRHTRRRKNSDCCADVAHRWSSVLPNFQTFFFFSDLFSLYYYYCILRENRALSADLCVEDKRGKKNNPLDKNSVTPLTQISGKQGTRHEGKFWMCPDLVERRP